MLKTHIYHNKRKKKDNSLFKIQRLIIIDFSLSRKYTLYISILILEYMCLQNTHYYKSINFMISVILRYNHMSREKISTVDFNR